jgi:phosphate transport system substrate-binding protein
VSAAAAEKLPEETDFRVSITNAKAADAYPIASFTWLLIQPQPRDPAKGEQIEKFIEWMLQPEAQRMAADLHYAPLPVPVIELVQQRLAVK